MMTICIKFLIVTSPKIYYYQIYFRFVPNDNERSTKTVRAEF